MLGLSRSKRLFVYVARHGLLLKTAAGPLSTGFGRGGESRVREHGQILETRIASRVFRDALDELEATLPYPLSRLETRDRHAQRRPTRISLSPLAVAFGQLLVQSPSSGEVNCGRRPKGTLAFSPAKTPVLSMPRAENSPKGHSSPAS